MKTFEFAVLKIAENQGHLKFPKIVLIVCLVVIALVTTLLINGVVNNRASGSSLMILIITCAMILMILALFSKAMAMDKARLKAKEDPDLVMWIRLGYGYATYPQQHQIKTLEWWASQEMNKWSITFREECLKAAEAKDETERVYREWCDYEYSHEVGSLDEIQSYNKEWARLRKIWDDAGGQYLAINKRVTEYKQETLRRVDLFKSLGLISADLNPAPLLRQPETDQGPEAA